MPEQRSWWSSRWRRLLVVGAALVVVGLVTVVAVSSLGSRGSSRGSGSGTRTRTVRTTSSHELATQPDLGMREQFTCGDCPLAEGGSKLARDLVTARRVNMTISDLPSGSRQLGPPPSSASGDKPFGVIDRGAALRFASCMRLSARQEADVMRNADQVLNVGSPAFGLPVTGAGAISGPNTSPGQEVIVSSWVDMTTNSSAAGADWQAYSSQRYAKCAPKLWSGLLSSFLTGQGAAAGNVGSRGSSRERRSVAVKVYPVAVPDGGHALVIGVQAIASRPKLRMSLFEGIMIAGRVEASVILGPIWGSATLGFSPLRLMQKVLVVMAARAVS